jgi:hypothetical protein
MIFAIFGFQPLQGGLRKLQGVHNSRTTSLCYILKDCILRISLRLVRNESIWVSILTPLVSPPVAL